MDHAARPGLARQAEIDVRLVRHDIVLPRRSCARIGRGAALPQGVACRCVAPTAEAPSVTECGYPACRCQVTPGSGSMTVLRVGVAPFIIQAADWPSPFCQ